MPYFSAASIKQLETCDMKLQVLMHEVIRYFDFKVIQGYRSEAQQLEFLAKGTTTLAKGKHNSDPSRAVDVAPYPVDWSDEEDSIRRFVYLAGFMMATAARLHIKLRWGGDWNQDQDIRDEKGKLRDWGHFELC